MTNIVVPGLARFTHYGRTAVQYSCVHTCSAQAKTRKDLIRYYSESVQFMNIISIITSTGPGT